MSVYANNVVDYKQMIVTEAYFGKSETLLEIEKQIGIIRRSGAVNKFKDINKSKEVQQLNRLFEKQFGMDIFSLHVEKSNTINAYTIPINRRIDVALRSNISKKVIATQAEGYRFKPDNNLCIICYIYTGLLMHPDITDAEIVAVILHELGHNFADAIYKEINTANKQFASQYLSFIIMKCLYEILMTLGAAAPIAIPKAIYDYRNNTNSVNKKKEQKHKENKFSGFITGIKATMSDFSNTISEIFRRIFDTNLILVNKKVLKGTGRDKYVKKSLNRINEIIADKFAGIYGYGPEQASCLLKMNQIQTKAEEFMSGIPWLDKFNKAYNDAIKDLYKFDCHPHVMQRLNEEIKTLEYELAKSDLDPRLVKDMQNQINQLKKLKDQAMKKVIEGQKNENLAAAFNKYVNSRDPNAVDKALEDKINECIDALIEDNKK